MTTINAKNQSIIADTYKDMWGDVFSIFRQACIPEDTCKDLVQDVFLKILGLDIIIESQLKALAVTIAYQKRTDYLRHRAYINNCKKDGGWWMERSYIHMEAEVSDILQVELKVIRCMSDKDARIYQMTRFEEKTVDEIVMETGLSKRAVEGRIYRSRMMVRGAVKKAIGF